MTAEIYTDSLTKTKKGISNLFICTEMMLPEFKKLDPAKTLFILPMGVARFSGSTWRTMLI